MHVHVQHESGEAKIWLEPKIRVARNWGLTQKRLAAAVKLVQEHEDEVREAWEAHFGR